MLDFTPTTPRNRGSARLLIAATLMLAAATAVAQSTGPAASARQHEVAARGAEVMPFDLAQTTHVFTKTPAGGVQRVVAKNPADTAQIKLIREHLAQIAQEFRRGDYGDPARIHGADMPGLAPLRAAPRGAVRIDDRALPDGGEITFRTSEPKLIDAIHAWFDAQVSDHGHDAVMRHDQSMRDMTH